MRIEHNEGQHRFEAWEEKQVGVLDYRRKGENIEFTHTGVIDSMKGRGVGAQLARAALEYARTQGLRPVPRCSFVATYLRRHPELAEPARLQ